MEHLYQDEELEEIESRLYSEAYHSKLGEDVSNNVILHNQQDNLSENFRYFEDNYRKNLSINNIPNFISLESNVQVPIIQNNITLIPPTNICVPNKVTVNQFTVPFIEILPPLHNNKFFNSWLKNNQHLINNKLSKKLYLRNKSIARKKKKKQEKRKQEEIISLVDDSEEECIVMSNIEKIQQQNYSNVECDVHDDDDDDDDIIFVPPPPQEIINVEDDLESTSNDKSNENEQPTKEASLQSNECGELSNTLESFNDFLENSNISNGSNNFNFSLHGFDFNNGNHCEFVQPNEPITTNEYCETESSTTCSNDNNTEFNNTVKTIVFNEVEFPKGDIFSEKNLETFGSLITPKRIPKLNTSKVNTRQNSTQVYNAEEELSNPNNTAKQCNKVLPNLSHIPLDTLDNSLVKNVNKKREEKDTVFKKNKKLSNNDIKEYTHGNHIVKKTNKKRKKKCKQFKETTLINNKTSKLIDIEQDINTCNKEGEIHNVDLIKNEQNKVGDSCDENFTIKRKMKSVDIANAGKVKNNIKRRKPKLSNNTNIQNEIAPCDEISLSQADEVIQKERNDFNLSDIIVIDEVNESDSDLEIIEASTCNNVNLNIVDDLQLANCKKNTEVLNTLENTISNFDVQTIQKTQSDDPEKWQIIDRDKTILIGSNSGPRCLKCRHVGHRAKNCIEKTGPLRCTLCGGINHQEPRCPNKICRQCGNKGDYSTSYCWSCFKFRSSECHICHMTGHISKTCPDLWRRYHVTTNDGPIVKPDEPLLKSKSQWWCSGCAKKGHLEHECNYYTRIYPPTTPAIITYDDVLNNQCLKNVPPEPFVQQDNNKKHIAMEVSTQQEIPSLLDVDIPDSGNLISENVNSVHSNYEIIKKPINIGNEVNVNCAINSQYETSIPGPVYHSKTLSLSKQNHFCGELQQTYTNSSEEIIDNNQTTIYLQYEKGIPQVNYLGLPENSYEKANIIEPKNTNKHFTIETTNSIVGPPSLLPNIPPINPVQNLPPIDISKKIHTSKNIIMSMKSVDIKKLLIAEFTYLDDQIATYNPRLLRDKFYKYNKLCNIKNLSTIDIKEKRFWFQILNMYIFGVHKFRDGNLHVKYLKEYLASTKSYELNVSKRKSLFSSYCYVFGFEKHVNVSYPKILKLLIQRYDEGKINKPLL